MRTVVPKSSPESAAPAIADLSDATILSNAPISFWEISVTELLVLSACRTVPLSSGLITIRVGSAMTRLHKPYWPAIATADFALTNTRFSRRVSRSINASREILPGPNTSISNDANKNVYGSAA